MKSRRHRAISVNKKEIPKCSTNKKWLKRLFNEYTKEKMREKYKSLNGYNK